MVVRVEGERERERRVCVRERERERERREKREGEKRGSELSTSLTFRSETRPCSNVVFFKKKNYSETRPWDAFGHTCPPKRPTS